MHLTRFTDYALRTLIYAAIKERLVSLDEISASSGMSRNHLIKAVNVLEKGGFVQTKRGVGGGISLARGSEKINIGDVVKCTEPGFNMVECFDEEKNTCPLAGCCALKKAMQRAKAAFLGELSAYTLHDISKNKKALLKSLYN